MTSARAFNVLHTLSHSNSNSQSHYLSYHFLSLYTCSPLHISLSLSLPFLSDYITLVLSSSLTHSLSLPLSLSPALHMCELTLILSRLSLSLLLSLCIMYFENLTLTSHCETTFGRRTLRRQQNIARNPQLTFSCSVWPYFHIILD